MGIDIYCGDKEFGTSYGHWNKIRCNIIKASFEYIQDKFSKDAELYKDETEDSENWIGKHSTYDIYMNEINKIIMIIDASPQINGDNSIKILIEICQNLNFLNALNYFEMGGLLALCNQSDCEGYYTSGNSLDICILFDKIEPFVKKYDCYSCIYGNIDEGVWTNKLYDVFEYSYKNCKKVIIT